jgi:hypothetical protein
MDKFIPILACLFIAIILGLFIQNLMFHADQNNRFNNWSAQCLEDGGVVSKTAISFTSEQYECIKDGKIINHID